MRGIGKRPRLADARHRKLHRSARRLESFDRPTVFSDAIIEAAATNR